MDPDWWPRGKGDGEEVRRVGHQSGLQLRLERNAWPIPPSTHSGASLLGGVTLFFVISCQHFKKQGILY